MKEKSHVDKLMEQKLIKIFHYVNKRSWTYSSYYWSNDSRIGIEHHGLMIDFE